MADSTLYDDGLVLLDRDGITLRRYYLPFGTSKRIAFDRIRRVVARPMGWLSGRGRVWGSGRPDYWLPLDWQRPRKDTLIVLYLESYLKPAFSPKDPDRVLDLLREKTGAA